MNIEEVARRGAAIVCAHQPWPDGDGGTRHRILLAALEAFAALGFHGSSLKDISARTGLSTAALYVHFESKEELLYTISSSGHQSALAVVQEAAQPMEDPAASVALLTYCFTRWHAENHLIARVVHQDWHALSPQHLLAIEELRRSTQDAVRSGLERSVRAGFADGVNVRVLGAAIISMGIDVARWYRPGRSLTPDLLAWQYCQLIGGLTTGGSTPAKAQCNRCAEQPVQYLH